MKHTVLRWIGSALGAVVMLLLTASVFYPALTAQVLAHATPDVSLYANWLAAQIMGSGADGVTMATGALLATTRAGKLAAKLNDTIEKMRAMLADAGDEALSVEQQAAYDALDSDRKKYAAAVSQAEQLAAAEAAAPAITTAPVSGEPAPKARGLKLRAEDDKARGFRSRKEFFTAVLGNSEAASKADVSDERLRPLATLDKSDKAARGEMAFLLPEAFTPPSFKATVGSDEQGEYDDRYGGFGLTTTRLPGLLERGFEGDPTAGRTMSVPMQTPSVEIMARTDSDHTTSVVGGLTVARRAEAAAAASSRGQLEMVTLKAASLFGFNYTTEELLADSPSTVVALLSGFETQFGAYMLNEKLRGLGGDQFEGVIGHACSVAVSKESGQVADTIVTANLLKMRARCWGYGEAVWLANHDTLPQLGTLSIGVGTAGALVWQTSIVDGQPDRLLGRPLIFTEYAGTIGYAGDIILVNWSQYLEGLYQPLQSAESMHVRFDRHERAFKLWLRNAGAPWWRAALTPAKSTATMSPIVTLQAR